MDQFPANSAKARETEQPREKIKPVTSAKRTEGKRRGLGKQFKETFFSGNGRDAMSYMVEDVVVPAIRDTLHDALRAGLDQLIYGDRARPRRGGGGGVPWASGPQPHIPYNRMNTSAPPQQQPKSLSRRSRARHSFDELIIPTRREADEVIDQMFELLSRYGQVSVADLYELTDIQSSHTDMKWGWVNLRGARALPLRQGGFILDLPEPAPFN